MSSSAIHIVRSSAFADATGLVHGFSTRTGGVSRVYRPTSPEGDLNLGFTAQDNPDHVRENRRRLLHTLHAPALQRFALLVQGHTDVIHTIEQPDDLSDDFAAPGTLRGDGLMTDRPGVLLAIGTADCIPVLLLDPVRRAVAAFHAGWRGTLAQIVEQGVGCMQQRYGTDPADVRAAIGPGIGPSSYAVSDDVHTRFASRFRYAPELFRTVDDRLHLDLWEANRRQLLDAGVRAELIDVAGQDTAAQTDRFFSYRAENGSTGRMLSVIGLTI